LPAICTNTLTGSATVAPRQISRPHPLRQLLSRAQTTDVALVWIERLGDVAEDSKGVQEPENDLEAHDTITALQPGDGLTRHARTIAKLSLG
jgi:hypothetical protein